jgi:3'(2'), 5'-bisphosphate nucleotidase
VIELNTAELRFALKATRQAALLIKDIQSELVSDSLTKEDRSPVTVADYAAQVLVAHLLRSTFPQAILVSEEDAAALRTDENRPTLDTITRFVQTRIQKLNRTDVLELIDYGHAESADAFWTLDPIDGTKGFLRGDQYAVALAYINAGRVEIGVLACPHLTEASTPEIGGPGSLVVAQRGQGAWTTPLDGAFEFKPLKVSQIADPARARFLRSFESRHTNVSQLDLIGQQMNNTAEPARIDSQAKYAILASGSGDIIFRLISDKLPDYKEKIWDQAAGALICEEAGGTVTDLDGQPLDFTQGRTLKHNRGVLASNGLLHPATLDAIKTVGA